MCFDNPNPWLGASKHYINFLCIYFIFLHFLLIFLIFWLQWINLTVVATGLEQYEWLKSILLKFRHIFISMVQIMVLWELLEWILENTQHVHFFPSSDCFFLHFNENKTMSHQHLSISEAGNGFYFTNFDSELLFQEKK